MYLDYPLLVLVSAPFVGSFLATAAIRMPRGISAVTGRSRCPSCDQALGARSLVPVLSWVIQGARCLSCAARISAYYPGVEIAATGIALLAAMTLSGDIAIISCLLGWTLLTLGIIDFRDRILPDVITLPLAIAGLGVIAFLNPDQIPSHVLAGLSGFGGAALIAHLYFRFRGRTGLGGGDIKLIGAAGVWVGPAGLPGVVLFASLSALVFATYLLCRNNRPANEVQIPFGPFLAAGLWLTWLYGPIQLGTGFV